tara:strand:+ start:121 stop:621 length:501 start_codon:yes stop_codon:yes gene_type:complete
MEGLAYWLFIAVLYFLSSLMKRRQQNFARKQLDEEDVQFEQDDFVETDTDPETMDDFFDQLRNYGKGFLESDDNKAEEEVEVQEKEYIDPEITVEPAKEETSRAIFGDLSKNSPEPVHPEYLIKQKHTLNTSELVSSLLNDDNKVKKAIILKEIFDKPRALRRAIR